MLSEKTHSQKRYNSFIPFMPELRGLSQRQCACGTHTMGGGQCTECQKKKISAGGRPLQTKLAISESGDMYEQEADRVAEQVMKMSPNDVSKRQKSGMSQPLVQRRASGGATGLAEVPMIVHEVLNSPGQPLDAATRAFFEPRFGTDLSHVRVHTDAKAVGSASAVNALAYTGGRNIIFGAGQHTTGTSAGQRLMAHELTHVAQQRAGTLLGQAGVSQSGDACELEADRVAERVMRMPEPVTQREHKVTKANMGSVFENDPIICKPTSRSSHAILRKPQQSPESTEFTRKGLPERVLRYLDKPSLFSGNPSVTATIRVKGIDIEFQDGGRLYIDRSEAPLDDIFIRQKLEKLEASLKWYIRILGPSLASEGKVSALAENELANRLFIIRRITEGKNLQDILSELDFLNIENFKFVAVSASIIPIIAGSAIAPIGVPVPGRAGMGRLAIREAEKKALGETEKKVLTEAEKKVARESEKKAIPEAGKKVVTEAEKKAATAAEKKGVEIVDAKGNPIGEFDKVLKNKFIEEKSAKGLGTLHPKTGLPIQTVDDWAKKQIYDKTVTRIENLLNKATATRATAGGSPTVPALSEIRGIRNLEFRIEAATAQVKNAVEKQLTALRAKYPGWTFTATFGP